MSNPFDALASHIEYYLPVYVPFFLTILSILAGIVTKRLKLTVDDLLTIHSDLVLGLFSFIIWAVVAYQQSGRIHLNTEYEITLVRVLILLFADFSFLLVGLILLKPRDPQASTQSIVLLPRLAPMTAAARNRIAHAAFLLLTVVLVFAPFALKTPLKNKPADAVKQDTIVFRVAVPYTDRSLLDHVGVKNWGDRRLVEIIEVKTTDRKNAVAAALQQLRASDRSREMYPSRDGTRRAIQYETDRVVVDVE